jgi:hypothetical protein
MSLAINDRLEDDNSLHLRADGHGGVLGFNTLEQRWDLHLTTHTYWSALDCRWRRELWGWQLARDESAYDATDYTAWDPSLDPTRDAFSFVGGDVRLLDNLSRCFHRRSSRAYWGHWFGHASTRRSRRRCRRRRWWRWRRWRRSWRRDEREHVRHFRQVRGGVQERYRHQNSHDDHVRHTRDDHGNRRTLRLTPISTKQLEHSNRLRFIQGKSRSEQERSSVAFYAPKITVSAGSAT